jgi:hypothetical protein
MLPLGYAAIVNPRLRQGVCHDTAANIREFTLVYESSPWLVENWLSFDWPVYVAFLLGLLALAGIVLAAAITTSWHD